MFPDSTRCTDLLQVACAAAALLILGCGVVATPVEAPSVAVAALPEVEPAPYRLEVGDQIAVKFWGNTELNEEVLIRPDGFISLPFVDEVKAAGLTPAELDAELTRRYTGELTRPEITVMVLAIAGHKVYVGGEVGSQGSFPLAGRMSLMQAIQQAGGFRISARREQVLLIRLLPDNTAIARSIDMRPVLSGADVTADVLLQPSDIVFVPRTRIENVKLFLEEYVYDLLPFQALNAVRIVEGPRR